MHETRSPRTARFMLLAAPLFIFATFTAAHAQSGRAQATIAPPQPPQPRGTRSNSSTLSVELPTPVAETPVPLIGGSADGIQTLSFVTPDANFERNVVKGAPLSAESVTEHVQTLGDGNRMVRKSSARLYRDTAGRTRREHTLTRGGVRAADGEEPRLIVINDPVGQVNYKIETWTGRAYRMMVPPGLAAARRRAMGDTGADASFGVLMPTSTAHRRMAEGDAAPAPPAPKKERLEAQLIEGVLAEGTRITVTIPAGEFDNEQPLEITHEQWYAPDLQMVVLMKHNDPRFGVTEFRLTNINRGEPAPDLFQLPAGYKLVDRPEGPLGPRGMPMLKRPGSDQ